MFPNFSIDPTKFISKRFKIKKLQYNTYEIDHTQVKGQLRLIALPINILEVPKNLLPQGKIPSDLPEFAIGTQSIASFTNAYANKKVSPPLTESDMRSGTKFDITAYVIDQGNEPWNEFILEGNPPILLKTRTILSKLEWYPDFTDQFGAPALYANHNTNHSVSIASTGESGMK